MADPDPRITPRKIIGISLTPELAGAVKQEAARRGLTLKSLFEEMWEEYLARRGD